MRRTAGAAALVAVAGGLGSVAGLSDASVVFTVLAGLLLVLAAALSGPRRFGLLLLTSGYGLGAAVSDSNITAPLVDLSGAVTLTPLKAAPYLLMLVGIAIVLTTSRGPAASAPRSLAFSALGLYLGFSGLGLMFPGASPVALLRLIQGLVPLAAAVIMTWSGRARWLLTCTLAAAGYIVVLGIGLLGVSSGIGEIPGSRLGAFTHPVVTAFAGALVLAVALHGVLARRYVILSVTGMAMGSAVLWASRGRAGFVAAVAMTVVLLSHRVLGAGRGRFLGTIIGSAAAVCVLSFGDGLWSWFTRGRPEELATFTGRTRLWALALDLIAQRPLVGWGPGLLRAGPVAEEVKLDQLGFGGHAHNALLEAMLSAGIIGGFLWLAALMWTGRQLSRGIWRSGYPSGSLLGFALWLGLLSFSVAEGSPAGFGIGWFLLCALVGEASGHSEEMQRGAQLSHRAVPVWVGEARRLAIRGSASDRKWASGTA